MKSALFILCAAWAASTAHAQNPASSRKPGLWESRTLQMTINGEDMRPRMKEMQENTRKALSAMQPGQRKAMQDMLAGQTDDPLVSRLCISAEMVKNQQPGLPATYQPRAGCAAPKVTIEGNRSTFEVSCRSASETTVIKGDMAVEGDQITTTAEMARTGADRLQHVTQTRIQSTFIGSDCGGLKPFNQIMAAMMAQNNAATQAAAKPAK